MTGSARSRVAVPFDFGTRRRDYYPHSGLDNGSDYLKCAHTMGILVGS